MALELTIRTIRRSYMVGIKLKRGGEVDKFSKINIVVGVFNDMKIFVAEI